MRPALGDKTSNHSGECLKYDSLKTFTNYIRKVNGFRVLYGVKNLPGIFQKSSCFLIPWSTFGLCSRSRFGSIPLRNFLIIPQSLKVPGQTLILPKNHPFWKFYLCYATQILINLIYDHFLVGSYLFVRFQIGYKSFIILKEYLWSLDKWFK